MTHSTNAEISFIKRIGVGTDATKHFSRLELLERYQYALTLRADWGDVDRVKVSNAVMAEIAEEMAK